MEGTSDRRDVTRFISEKYIFVSFWEGYKTDVLLGETTVTSSHVSGERFPVGSTEVVYSATDQTTQITSECRFSIEIVQPGSPTQPSPQWLLLAGTNIIPYVVGLEFFCEDTPQVSNGRLECTHTNFVYTCRAQCNDGFVRREEFKSNHTCGSRGWMPPFPTNFQYVACLREYTQLRYQNTTLFFLWIID